MTTVTRFQDPALVNAANNVSFIASSVARFGCSTTYAIIASNPNKAQLMTAVMRLGIVPLTVIAVSTAVFVNYQFPAAIAIPKNKFLWIFSTASMNICTSTLVYFRCKNSTPAIEIGALSVFLVFFSVLNHLISIRGFEREEKDFVRRNL